MSERKRGERERKEEEERKGEEETMREKWGRDWKRGGSGEGREKENEERKKMREEGKRVVQCSINGTKSQLPSCGTSM